MLSLLSPDSRSLQLTGNTLHILVGPPHPLRMLRLLPRNLSLSLDLLRAPIARNALVSNRPPLHAHVPVQRQHTRIPHTGRPLAPHSN